MCIEECPALRISGMHRLHTLYLGAAASLLFGASSFAMAAPANPFETPSTLPLQAPPFDKIKDTDYKPAFEEAMKQHLAEVEAIANDKAAPTFENTFVALEKSGRMLDRVDMAFFGVAQANTNPTLDKTRADVAPELAAHQDAIFLNPKLFARVKAVYDKRDTLKLDPESAQLLKVYYLKFVHAGANLSDADKAKLREINKEDASLETTFQQKLIAATKDGALVVDDKAQLAGLSEGEIAAAAKAAADRGLKGKYLIPLQNTTQQPLLVSLSDRGVRERLFDNSWTRTEKGDANDTRATIARIAQLRAEKAKLLGYPNYSAYALYDQMAKTPQAVESFLRQLIGPTAVKAAEEARLIQAAIDKDGSQLGMIYFDYFKRDNKSGGAWMSNFVNQTKLLGTKPVVYNVANFTKPAPGQPALLSFDDVTTMFHEFGHALHGLFATQKYQTLSGTNVARDFVEFPSQFNENWALDPTVLKHYAINYKTGKPIPQELVDKIKKSQTWGQGYQLGELLAASELDMQWHELDASAPKQDVDKFEEEALRKTHTDYPNVPTRYRSSYFLHIWANGYASGYYAYQWTVMLADDAFDWFEKNGGLTRQNGQRFRDMILSKGHTEDYGPMFRAFYGKDPDIGPMLEHRGLKKK